MPAPATHPGWTALVASLWRLPRGLAHPVVLTFLVAAVLSYLSADGIRAAYLMAVGLALAWDQARRRSAPAETARQPAVFSGESAASRQAAMRRLRAPAAAGAIIYSLLIGLFQRYSWPATVLADIPAVAAVIIAWLVSAGSETEPAGPLDMAGAAAWAVVWVGASAWEVAALFLQPTLSTNSYAHPTLSVLANTILASMPGRSIVAFGWLALGWYLVRR